MRRIFVLLFLGLSIAACSEDAPPKPVNTAGEQYIESLRQDGLTRTQPCVNTYIVETKEIVCK